MDITSFVLGYNKGKASGGGSGGGGTGGGGGAFAPGVYLKADYPKFPSKIPSAVLFELNGEIYLVQSVLTGTSGKQNMYKLVNGAWSLLLTEFTYINETMYSVDTCAVHNGKAHLWTNKTHHLVFDGTTVTKLNDFPALVEGEMMASVNGVLYAYCKGNGSIYTWNEAEDTWTLLAKLNNKTYTLYYLLSVNNELRIIDSKKYCKLTDGALEQIGTAKEYVNIVRDGMLYCVSTVSGISHLFRYDPATDSSTDLGPVFVNAIGGGYGTRLWDSGEALSIRVGGAAAGDVEFCALDLHIIEASE